MSNSITRRLENEEVSTCLSLPDASELDTTVTDDSSDSARKTLSSLPDADQVNDSYLESDSGITTLHYQEGNDRSYFSDTNDSEYHESSPNTPTPSHHEVTDQPWLSGAGEVGNSRNFDSDASALTPGNHHVIDQYSFLSDAPDAENSELLTPDHQQVINQSYLPDASYVSDTTIKMESPDKSVPGHGSSVPDVSGVDNSGRLTESSAHSEGVEHSKIPPNFTNLAFSDI